VILLSSNPPPPQGLFLPFFFELQVMVSFVFSPPPPTVRGDPPRIADLPRVVLFSSSWLPLLARRTPHHFSALQVKRLSFFPFYNCFAFRIHSPPLNCTLLRKLERSLEEALFAMTFSYDPYQGSSLVFAGSATPKDLWLPAPPCARS